jgi:nucleotide-binding universal stress UspA family protein
MTAPVVVGVDGSDSSWRALRWAAAETRRGGGRLRILLAYRRPTGALRPEPDAPQANLIVDDAAAEARAASPGIDIDGLPVPGNATSALLDAAADARLLVVGNRGRGGFTSLLLGSVSQQVATHAPCPVAVVRGRSGAASGPVVVGLNGLAPASLAAELAFEQAAARGCSVVAVHAYPGASPLPDGAERRRRDLVAAVAPWRDTYPDVPVEYAVVEGQPGQALVTLSRHAQLTVVGARGVGGFTGLLLGSTGQQVIHHADCPVLIARTRADR